MLYTLENNERKNLRPGFTFIELVIAITILAILGAIVGPPMLRYISKAGESAATSSLKSIKTAIDSYKGDTGKFPNTLSDLVYRPTDPKAGRNWKGPYLEKLQEDPWHNEFQYRPGRVGATPPYELFSYGKDGEGSPQESWIDVWKL